MPAMGGFWLRRASASALLANTDRLRSAMAARADPAVAMVPLSLAWRMYACVAGVEATASKLQMALNSPGDLTAEQHMCGRTVNISDAA
jgi:hypothetical protein